MYENDVTKEGRRIRKQYLTRVVYAGHARTFFSQLLPILVCMLPNLYSNRLSQACLFKQAIDDLDPIQTHQEKTTIT